MFRTLAKTIALAAALAAPAVALAGPTVDAIKQRGALRCGVNTGLLGFSAPDSAGRWNGIDADFCRAVATAILGDPTKVQYVPTNAQTRFTALQSGEIDLLSRNTTWTSSRDSTLGSVFAGTLFYDGQGFMVKKSSGVTKATDLNGATVCVQPGTTTELNLNDYFRTKKMTFKPVVIAELNQIEQAFFAGRCDVYTTDISGLAATRLRLLPSEGSYFQCADISEVSDLPEAEFCQWLTREVGVAAIPLSAFYGDGFDQRVVRFCFAKKRETLERAAVVLRERLRPR